MYGIDLDEELANHRYGWLLDRILDLPDPYSRFREAMSQDEEMAELLLELEEAREEDEGESPPTLRYSQVGFQEVLLMSIDQTIKAMRAEAPVIHRATKSKKPDYPKPWPRVDTALDRLKRKRAKEAADRISRLFGFDPEDL